jgi:cytoskeletal protein CcmA (bactofilin family)
VLKQIISQKSESGNDSVETSASSPSTLSGSTPSSHSSSQASKMSSSKNVLSSDVEIKGTIKFSNDLIIDGRIDGEVVSDGSLTVGENANIKGDIRTKSVVVFGKIDGNITVKEQCDLKSNAEIIGDIKAGMLSIESGATFMGNSQVGTAAAKPGAISAPASGNKPV